MAQQESEIKLKGRAGGLSFYKNSKGYQARSAKGVDPKRIAKDPSFKRSRENASEFGRAVKAAKYLRNVLGPLLIHQTDGTMVNRLNSRLTRILKADDVNLRGERQVNIVNAEMLRFFDFNRNAPLHETLLASYQVHVDTSAGHVLIQLPAFYPKVAIVSPAKATHFRLVAAAVQLDFSDMGSQLYPELSTQTTEVLPIMRQVQSLSLALPITEESVGSTVVVVLGLLFFEEFLGELYPMKAKKARPLGIVDVRR